MFNSASVYLIYVKLESHLVPLVSNDKAVLMYLHILYCTVPVSVLFEFVP